MLQHKRGRKGPYPKSDDEQSGSEDDFEGMGEEEDGDGEEADDDSDEEEEPVGKVSSQCNSFKS